MMEHESRQDSETYPGSASSSSYPQEYIKTLPGILKIVQMFASFLTFILAIVGGWGHMGGGWVAFVAISGLIESIIYFVLHIFKFIPEIMANYIIEAIIYCIWTLFFFISVIVAAVAAPYYSVAGAASFFSFVCMAIYGVDAGMQVMALREKWGTRHTGAGQV